MCFFGEGEKDVECSESKNMYFGKFPLILDFLVKLYVFFTIMNLLMHIEKIMKKKRFLVYGGRGVKTLWVFFVTPSLSSNILFCLFVQIWDVDGFLSPQGSSLKLKLGFKLKI